MYLMCQPEEYPSRGTLLYARCGTADEPETHERQKDNIAEVSLKTATDLNLVPSVEEA